MCLPYSLDHAAQVPPPGYILVSFGNKGVEAYIDPLYTSIEYPLGVVFKENTVCRQTDVPQTLHLLEGGEKFCDSAPYKGFSSGHANLCDAGLDSNAHNSQHLFIPEDVLMTDKRHAFLRHAVHTAQVAPVSDRYSQVIDLSVMLIYHIRYPW